MSPRRKVDPADEAARATAAQAAATTSEGRGHRMRATAERVRKSRGQWDLPALTTLVALLLVAAGVAGGLMLWSHESDRRTTIRDAQVLDYARTFMTEYTSLDPFNANDYTARVLKYATGEFETEFKGRENEIAVIVARSEPSSGSVVEAGVEQWHGDDTVSLLITVNTVTATADGKGKVEDASRWVITAVEEGQQWKISQLTQVI